MTSPESPQQAAPSDGLRRIPQVERILGLAAVRALLGEMPREDVVAAVRESLDSLRVEIVSRGLRGAELESRVAPEALERDIVRRARRRVRSGYRRVVNATGIILHTGLGRAVLAPGAVAALRETLRGYSLVELDLETGERGRRDARVEALLRDLTGAEAATVVNNNAAATLVILAALARGREVVISRGQLVEIGGSYRIPDILTESGARLVEVGTTNRTYVDDYRRAVTSETGMLLQVHTSNYEIRGFVHQAPLEDLVALGRERNLPVVCDLGSGCFVDLSPHGFRPEPLVAERVRAGADLVCFSGDKLLGGPQCGIIVGRDDRVRRIREHPLYRPLRVDKVTLALLEATLRVHRDPVQAEASIPVLRAISEPVEGVRARAEACRARLESAAAARGERLDAEVVPSAAQAGSGALPAQEIPSAALAVRPPEGLGAGDLARQLRARDVPIVSRIQEGMVLLDFRTVLPGEEEEVAAAVLETLAGAGDAGETGG